jgi:hypothetical protein
MCPERVGNWAVEDEMITVFSGLPTQLTSVRIQNVFLSEVHPALDPSLFKLPSLSLNQHVICPSHYTFCAHVTPTHCMTTILLTLSSTWRSNLLGGWHYETTSHGGALSLP